MLKTHKELIKEQKQPKTESQINQAVYRLTNLTQVKQKIYRSKASQ